MKIRMEAGTVIIAFILAAILGFTSEVIENDGHINIGDVKVTERK